MDNLKNDKLLRQFAEVFAAGREYPETVGKIAYARAREVIGRDAHWSAVWTDLYERPVEECLRVIELGIAGWQGALNNVLLKRFTMDELIAKQDVIADVVAEVTSDPTSVLDTKDDSDLTIEEYAEALLAKPGSIIAWAFLIGVGLRHHLAGSEVHETFTNAASGCDSSWIRLLVIDPMVIRTAAFRKRLEKATSTPGDPFASQFAKAVKKHESDSDWDTARQFEAVMRDLLQVEGAKPLRYEDVFLLCQKYGGSSFGDHISLRAEAAKARKRIDLKGRSKTDPE